MSEPDLTRSDRATLDQAQQAAMDPDSNAEPEFQAKPPDRPLPKPEEDDEPTV